MQSTHNHISNGLHQPHSQTSVKSSSSCAANWREQRKQESFDATIEAQTLANFDPSHAIIGAGVDDAGAATETAVADS